MDASILITGFICVALLAVLRIKLDLAMISALGEEVLQPRPRPSNVKSDILAFVWRILEIITAKWRQMLCFVMSVNLDRKPAIARTLDMRRDFSSILTYSLNAEGMLKHFLLFLKETLSVNRAAIFLNHPATSFPKALSRDGRHLRAMSAIGLSANLLDHFELSFDSGIGGQIFRLGRILRRDSPEVIADAGAQSEFQILGGHVAVPMADRNGIIGIAVFDNRVTGEPLANAELELIFHLLEQVGLALRNIWLHDQIASNNEMMSDVLRELSSACIVVDQDLKVLHANKSARRHFGQISRRTGELAFTDLPQELGAKIYQVLKTGIATGSFRYEPKQSATIYNVNIVPFQRGDASAPVSALLTADDLTQEEQLLKLEVEAANLRLVRSMGDRIANEIGNAMVPLSLFQQSTAELISKPNYVASVQMAVRESVKRVSRLINQMRFLNRDTFDTFETFPLSQMIEEAFFEARLFQSSNTVEFNYNEGEKPIVIKADRIALKHAFSEILLNAIQANPSNSKIDVRMRVDNATAAEHPQLEIEVEDNGPGFDVENAEGILTPFYTSRDSNLGIGLGLTVSGKIIENQRGRIEIGKSKTGLRNVVRIYLPMETPI